MKDSRFVKGIESLIFDHKPIVIGIFALITLFLGYTAATQLRIDAGFSKQLPLKHEYMQTFVEYFDEFGGADRVLVALVAKDGDMFDAEFFETLKQATDAVFFVPGVDRPRVTSLFTPNTRYLEVVEDGIQSGPVIPADFKPEPESLEKVRKNILKAGLVGRLVANDFSGALISATLLEFNPDTQEKLDYFEVARRFEEDVRGAFETDDISVHITGFAKVIGDVKDGANRVLLFFLIAIVITTILVYLYSQSWRITFVPVICSLLAVIWQLGLLPLIGIGIDPMGLLVPFLVFAIGVSHGVQMISSVRMEMFDGATPDEAARTSFRRLLLPGGIALISDTIGFITILLIEIQVIQEMAIAASTGVAAIILTNLILLPVLLSYINPAEDYEERLKRRAAKQAPFWEALTKVSERPTALIIILVALGLFGFGWWKGSQVKIGDLQAGVPELRPDSRYNLDSVMITEKFSIGVDLIQVIVQSEPDACIDHEKMAAIDEFAWHMRNQPGVQDVLSLPQIGRVVWAGWNEGYPKWGVLSRDSRNLVQSVARIETSTGLLNEECSVMPVMIFTTDHKAETISSIVQEVKDYREAHPTEGIEYRLATGNVGVMAATNEDVQAAQFPILLGVFSAVILLCWLSFRSIKAVLAIIIPLGLVSLLAYALMSFLGIGLKVNTLPVVALGVGIGVDYGIYIYSRFKSYLDKGEDIQTAFHDTLKVTGNAVIFAGITLGIGVFTWIFSPLQFQADMGILLTFMFVVNMLGAILLLPAIASWLLPADRHRDAPEG